mmetsp:Transcript_43190/g.101547  ORF Transcript_43190/g.101547 Transcript_43190/m.101547 type:complete len:242 (+) Transcript_43190:132-857(+)
MLVNPGLEQHLRTLSASCQLHAHFKHTFLHFEDDDDDEQQHHWRSSAAVRSSSCPARVNFEGGARRFARAPKRGDSKEEEEDDAGNEDDVGEGGEGSPHHSSWVATRSVTTLQCLGISNWLGTEKFVQVLEANGFHGCYNYIHIPRNNDGQGKGFCFVNMTTVSAAMRLVDFLHGKPLPCAENGRRRVRFAPAKKQGYSFCLQQMRKYTRVTNSALKPLVTTEDGLQIIMAPPDIWASSEC